MVRDTILRNVDVFLDAPDQNDQQLVAILLKKGVQIETAERFVAFLPIAFGRAVLERMGAVKFSDTFVVKETGKQYRLTDEAIFNEAQALANESFQTGVMSKDMFSAVAMRSAELRAANNALNQGTKIDGAPFSPVVIWGYTTFGKNTRAAKD
jgi:hypothetical protein